MDDIVLLDAVERYLKGEMNEEEKFHFEELRKNSAEVDMLVVEHSMFLHQMDEYGRNRQFKHQLHEVHNQLLEAGDIQEGEIKTGGTVIRLWNKYKRVTGIAASIAGVTALFISGLVSYFSPSSNKHELVQLNRKIDQVIYNVREQSSRLNDMQTKVPLHEVPTNGGTGFLIDGKGYLITNAHVVKGASTIVIQDAKGEEYKADIVRLITDKDLAILKIDDEDYKPITTVPYSFKKGNVDLGEQIFTLGYPRDEIVYNEGYMSAKTGYKGDTIACQIAVSANPGNSGGPIINKNGEVVGILSTAQQNAQGVVFAIKSKHILQAINELKKDTTYQRIKVPATSTIKGEDRVQQIKKIEDCIFMVKTFTK